MSKYILSCCSTVDLKLEHLNKRNINYVSFHYSLNGKEYPDDLGQTMSHEDFYKELAKGAETKTSQVNVEQFINFFTPFLEDGFDILHLSTSYGISGAYNSATLAREILLESYPNRTINIINSLAASSGYGLLMDKVADLKDQGLSLDDLTSWVEENKLNAQHWFYSTDLSYFLKGGRISKANAVIGSVLNVNPILEMDSVGKLVPRQKVIGKKRVQKKMIEKMIESSKYQLGYDEKCYISHSNMESDALELASKIEATFKHLKGKVLINSIGTTVGSHTGPGTIALFYWGNKRVD